MSEFEALRRAVEELTATIHAQAKQLERLVKQVERSTGSPGLTPEFETVAAETAALMVRLKTPAPADPA